MSPAFSYKTFSICLHNYIGARNWPRKCDADCRIIICILTIDPYQIRQIHMRTNVDLKLRLIHHSISFEWFGALNTSFVSILFIVMPILYYILVIICLLIIFKLWFTYDALSNNFIYSRTQLQLHRLPLLFILLLIYT